MNEVLTRRFGHGKEEEVEAAVYGISRSILMDGGKGEQVNIALEVLDKLNLDIPVCGMVRYDRPRTRGFIITMRDSY